MTTSRSFNAHSAIALAIAQAFCMGCSGSACWATVLFVNGFVADRERIEGRWGANYNVSKVSWMLDGAGQITGSDVYGCSYRGSLSSADPLYNLHAVDTTLSGCLVSGNYFSLGTWLPGPINDRSNISIDDEGGARDSPLVLVRMRPERAALPDTGLPLQALLSGRHHSSAISRTTRVL